MSCRKSGRTGDHRNRKPPCDGPKRPRCLDGRRVEAKASEMTERLEWISEFTSSMVLT